jgi:hypothetical protein
MREMIGDSGTRLERGEREGKRRDGGREREKERERERKRVELLHITRTLSGGHERALTAALALRAKLSADTGLSAGSPLPLRKSIKRQSGTYQR